MDRSYYLNMAAQRLRMPIGTDLILARRPDPEATLNDGRQLGEVLCEAADRFSCPLGFPLMDLRIEKEWLLGGFDVPSAQADTWHFSSALGDDHAGAAQQVATGPLTTRMHASLEAIAYTRDNSSALPMGMCIGPFSLMTKLLADPISGVYLNGVDPDDTDAKDVRVALEMATTVVVAWARLQARAGAKALVVCEPACSNAYLSPKQLASQPEMLDDLAINNLRRLRDGLAEEGCDFVLHDCGELSDHIVRSLAALDPVLLSFGSPTDIPTVANLINEQTVLFGNLPSKQFYSDTLITVEQVAAATLELEQRMAATGHAFVTGTECDVLSVPGSEDRIMAKVMAMIGA